jgi:ABC-type Fe3+ transport system substrate-binding protein
VRTSANAYQRSWLATLIAQRGEAARKGQAAELLSAPMALAVPNPGWGAVPVGSRQPVLAARLLDFLLDPQVNAAYAAATHEFPVVPGAALLSPQTEALGAWSPAAPDWTAVLRALPMADAMFAEVGWK